MLQIRIGNGRQQRQVGKAREPAELAPPTLGHRCAQFIAEVAEIQERRCRGEFLAHKQHGDGRGQQIDHRRRTHCRLRGDGSDALAEGAIAHLVVALQERHKGLRWQMRAHFPARGMIAIGRGSALIGEAFHQAAPQMADRRVHIIHIVAICLTGTEDVERVVNVVVPLGHVSAQSDMVGHVSIVFQDQVHMGSSAEARMHPNRQLGQYVSL